MHVIVHLFLSGGLLVNDIFQLQVSCNKKLAFPSDPTLYLGLQCALVASNIYVFQCNVHSRVHPVGL